jgi:hypothetical protein
VLACSVGGHRLPSAAMGGAAAVVMCALACGAGAASASQLGGGGAGVGGGWRGEPGMFANPPPLFRGSVDDTSCNVEEVERANTQQVRRRCEPSPS